MNIIEVLKKNNLTISCAESLTSGLVASNIASISGASSYFKGGIVTYSKEAKETMLDIPMEDIVKYGVYSFETAISMAKSVREKFKANIGISTTGVAGPGDDEGVKCGTVYFAIDINGTIYTRNTCFTGARNEVRQSAADYLISETINILEKNTFA